MEWMTPNDVAQLFDVDPKTIIRWTKQGLGPPAIMTPAPTKPRYKYLVPDVLEWIAEQREAQSTTEAA